MPVVLAANTCESEALLRPRLAHLILRPQNCPVAGCRPLRPEIAPILDSLPTITTCREFVLSRTSSTWTMSFHPHRSCIHLILHTPLLSRIHHSRLVFGILASVGTPELVSFLDHYLTLLHLDS